ncbi:MAG: multicopper oxidase domain-containing protein [Candidatus Gracilibacteria bacterium]|nr:multicopper oxidase domain-containing protein [Candidatus Gracilibacteria bacterium]
MEEFLSKKADKKLRLTIGMNGMKGGMGGMGGMNNEEDTDEIEWEDNMAMMNKMSSDQMMEWKLVDEDTKNENMDIEWKFKKGQFVKVEIYNDPKSMHPMQHPVHFHGQRFVVLTRDGKVNDNLQWKDTTLVRNGEKIEILVEMTNVGTWMSHCHIAEHLQSGMMMNFKVED